VSATSMAYRKDEASSGGPSPADPWSEIRLGLQGTRSDLVPALQRVQAAFGYLSPGTVRRVARWLRLTPNEVYGVATFYAQFRFTPPGRHRVRVCLGTACHVKGGEQMLDTVERRLHIHEGETTPDGEYNIERVACLGCCALAPVVTMDEDIYGQVSVLKLQGILDDHDEP
jgi:NADH-quinone oxidoreductase subunit E